MRLLFSFVFFLFSVLPFQVQAQVLIEYPISLNMDQFDWSAFSDKETVQKETDFNNEIFKLLGPEYITTGLNIGKLDLVTLEQELALYKSGIKQGLSEEEIKSAEEAIKLYRENILSIESQIQSLAGLGDPAVALTDEKKREAYRNSAWELYKGDHEIIFNMVEKKDENLYKILGSDDEVYAGFIAPYVESGTKRIEEKAQAYYDSLQSAYKTKSLFNRSDLSSLNEMYLGSLEIYNCFKKNFKNPVGVGQQNLEAMIKSWHRDQGLLGVDGFIETYKAYGLKSGPGAIIRSLLEFREAPNEVKIKLESFFREIWNDETLKLGTKQTQKSAHVKSLIGLKYLGALNEEEERAFEDYLEKGIIKAHPNGVTYSIRLP